MTSYYVRLVMQVDADSPGEAVQDFVDRQTAYGLRDWVFRAETMDEKGNTVVEGYFDGFGVAKDLDQIRASQQEALAEAEAEADAEWVAPATPVALPAVDVPLPLDDDAALEALAQELNDENPAQ